MRKATDEQEPTDDDIWLEETQPADLEGGFDEPEAVAEYVEELNELLYESEISDPDLSRRLRVDEFIASINGATLEERTQIVGLLNGLSPKRLGSWLSWMRGQHWTGSSLLLFLEFRFNYWEENEEWWESVVWHSWIGHWWV